MLIGYKCLPGNGEILSERGLSGEDLGLSDAFGGNLGSLLAKAESRYICARSWFSATSSIMDFAKRTCSFVPEKKSVDKCTHFYIKHRMRINRFLNKPNKENLDIKSLHIKTLGVTDS